MQEEGPYTVKKGYRFSSQDGMSLIKQTLAGNNLIIPPKESLVSGIPAGDGKIGILFLQCTGRGIQKGLGVGKVK